MLKILSMLKTGGSILTGLGVGVAGVGATEMYIRGKDSFTGDVIRDVQEVVGGAGAEANNGIFKTNLFAFLKMIGEVVMTLTNGQFGSSLVEMGNKGILFDSDRDAKVDSTDKTKPVMTRTGNDPSNNSNTPDDPAGSELAGTATLGAAAVAKGLGVKAIPGLASAFAAGSAVWDVGSYVADGEIKKAGVRLVSGAVDTVLSAGGFLTMAFGTAAREGIEEGAQLILGNDVDMPDSPTLQVVKSGYDWAIK